MISTFKRVSKIYVSYKEMSCLRVWNSSIRTVQHSIMKTRVQSFQLNLNLPKRKSDKNSRRSFDAYLRHQCKEITRKLYWEWKWANNILVLIKKEIGEDMWTPDFWMTAIKRKFNHFQQGIHGVSAKLIGLTPNVDLSFLVAMKVNNIFGCQTSND